MDDIIALPTLRFLFPKILGMGWVLILLPMREFGTGTWSKRSGAPDLWGELVN